MTALVLKATLALAVALLVVLAARKTRASLRHMVLAASFAFLLLLPFADRFAPRVQIPEERVAPVLRVVPRVAPNLPAIPREIPTNWRGIAIRTYAAGAALLLGWLALGVLRLRRLASSSEVWLDGTARMNEIAHEANIRRPALVVTSDDISVPMTFGFRTSTIVFPESAKTWDGDALDRAIRHELEHVRREDWALQLLARAVCALYWPHPLVWAAWRRFCFEAERACDDAVVSTFDGAEAYAGQLVTLARSVRGMRAVPALGMAGRSRLSARVAALLDRSQRRGPHGKLATAFAIGVTMFFLVAVAPAQLVAAVKAATHEPRFNPSPLAEAFIELAEEGNIDGLTRLMDAGIDVNLVVDGDGTALIAAAGNGDMETVQFLLARGADVNLPSPGDGSPLIAAATSGDAAIVEVLLDRGARIDEMVEGDENALIQAAWHGHEAVVALLIRRGANVNARYVEGREIRTPLRMARRFGRTNVERMLIAAGARE